MTTNSSTRLSYIDADKYWWFYFGGEWGAGSLATGPFVVAICLAYFNGWEKGGLMKLIAAKFCHNKKCKSLKTDLTFFSQQFFGDWHCSSNCCFFFFFQNYHLPPQLTLYCFLNVKIWTKKSAYIVIGMNFFCESFDVKIVIKCWKNEKSRG